MRVRSCPEVDMARVTAESPDGVFVISADGDITYVNRAAEEVLGWPVDELLGRSGLDLVHPDDVRLVLSSLETVQGKRLGTPIEVRVRDATGAWRWLEIIGRDCTAVRGIAGIVCTARDLTQRRMWEVAAGDTTLFQQVVQHAAAVVLLLDADGVIRSVNGAFSRLLGHDPSAAVGAMLASFTEPGSERELADAIAEASVVRCVPVEVPMRAVDGPPVPIHLEIVNLLDDPVVRGFVVTAHDISALHAAKRNLEYLATHDPLTGLPNRSMLHDRLERLLAAGRPLTLLFVDLDRFKPVNDQLGHETGDQLLRAVARRLVGAVEAADLVARVGGDEFVVLALGVRDPGLAVALAHRLELVLRHPFVLPAGTVRIGASIGVAVAGPRSTVASLLAEADLAMYASKPGA